MLTDRDMEYVVEAIEESRKSVPSPKHYRVGALIILPDGTVFKGYTGETGPHNHAEEEAVSKALKAGADLTGAVIYSSMEPCSTRSSKPRSCCALIIENSFSKVVYALAEPSCFVECRGDQNLRDAGIEVLVADRLAPLVREINSHLLDKP